jgi:hypothetical protein
VAQLRVKDELVGQRVRCPACQATTMVESAQTGTTPPKPKPPRAGEDKARPQKKPEPAPKDMEDEEEPPRRRRPQAEDNEESPEQLAPRPAPRPQTVLRILVLVFAILGGLAAGYLGFRWYQDTNDPIIKAVIDADRKLLEQPGQASGQGAKLEEAKTRIADYDKFVKASYILMAGLPVGVLAGALAFLRTSPIIASVLMLAVMIGPGVLHPRSLVFTSPFLVGAVLALLIKSKPRAAGAARPPRRREVDEDEAEA